MYPAEHQSGEKGSSLGIIAGECIAGKRSSPLSVGVSYERATGHGVASLVPATDLSPVANSALATLCGKVVLSKQPWLF